MSFPLQLSKYKNIALHFLPNFGAGILINVWYHCNGYIETACGHSVFACGSRQGRPESSKIKMYNMSPLPLLNKNEAN